MAARDYGRAAIGPPGFESFDSFLTGLTSDETGCSASAITSSIVETRRHSRAPPASAYALTVNERRTSMTTTTPQAARAPSIPVA